MQALAEKWLKPLGLLWWHVETHYYDSAPEFRAGTGVDAYMSVEMDWRYATATISVNCPEIVSLSDERLEFNFVHECCHILTSEVFEALRPDGPEAHHEEHVATVLAKAFLWVREAGIEEGREQEKEGLG